MGSIFWTSAAAGRRQRNGMYPALFRLAWLCLFCRPAFAQPADLPFLHLKSGVETPATYAEFIFKDWQGFIWLGTEQGLARFDGHRMELFSEAQGLKGLIVTSPFFEDTVNN